MSGVRHRAQLVVGVPPMWAAYSIQCHYAVHSGCFTVCQLDVIMFVILCAFLKVGTATSILSDLPLPGLVTKWVAIAFS